MKKFKLNPYYWTCPECKKKAEGRVLVTSEEARQIDQVDWINPLTRLAFCSRCKTRFRVPSPLIEKKPGYFVGMDLREKEGSEINLGNYYRK